MNTVFKYVTVASMLIAIASITKAALPDPGMEITRGSTAVVITDPQNDFLSPEGVTWGVVGKSVTANNTVENIETLLKTAKASGIPVFISPHYYFPTDNNWQFEGALERLMHNIGMFDREGQLNLEGFEDSGADWLEQYKPYIDDGETVVASPHKVYGPENNDLMLQLRKRGIDKVILAGMSANLCVESHMRELLSVGKSVKANNTVKNIKTLLKTAKANDIPVFISPHYYFPTDNSWQFEGALERLMHNIGMFDREGQLNLEGFEDSGADWLEQYKPYIDDGETVVASPHKVYGPENNDLMLQLRKRGIDKVILAGMSANLCVESHMRELLERGFQVAVVTDATAAAQVEEGDGYAAALVNFRFIANDTITTKEAVASMSAAR